MVTVHIYSKTFLLIKWSHGETYKSQYCISQTWIKIACLQNFVGIRNTSVSNFLLPSWQQLCFLSSLVFTTTASNSLLLLPSLQQSCCCGVCLELRKTMASASDTNYCNTESRDLSYGFPYVKVRKLPKSQRIIGSKILTHSIDRGITEDGLWAQFT